MNLTVPWEYNQNLSSTPVIPTKRSKQTQRFMVYSPSTHGKIRNRVVIRLEDFGVIENFISKGVEAVEAHPNIGGRHPFLGQTETPSEHTREELEVRVSTASPAAVFTFSTSRQQSSISQHVPTSPLPLRSSEAHPALPRKPYLISSCYS